ncbi:MAG TPA: hypothetical protein VGQ22_08610, partial [Steroidobacteraceae bacterium]|nr:hypothetical protein [Steroidobacteraceae bacterium]
WQIIGGLNRIRIARIDTDTCFAIQLVNPGTNSSALTLPADWAFEFARAVQPIGACNPAYLGPISNMFEASDATGTITWTASGTPMLIENVQVTLTFANPPMWCPPSTTLSATNLEVAN